MNTNPYPKGRWTTPKLTEANPIRPTLDEAARQLDQARMRDLFWCSSEGSIVSEAQQRIERLLDSAVRKPSATPTEEAAEFSPLAAAEAA